MKNDLISQAEVGTLNPPHLCKPRVRAASLKGQDFWDSPNKR